MKVVIQSDARIWGGNEKWLVLVGEGLAARGHEVVISCKPGKPVDARARALGLRVTHARPGGDLDAIGALRFAAMLRREDPDALLLTSFKKTLQAGWAARRAGVRRVVERMGIEQGLPGRWKYRHAFRHYVDAMIVNSRVIRERWLESAPWFPADEVHVILNGVRVPSLAASTVRDELGIERGAVVVAGAGRLEPRKGFDLLVEAFASAGGHGHLLLAGRGDDEPALRAAASRLGVGDRVHFLGFRDDLANVLLGSDVFVLPSRREGMANVMLEAMAAGCLVVAAEVSGVREALGPRDGRPPAGWIVPPEDVPALARAIARATEVARREGPGVDGRGVGGDSPRAEARWRVERWFSPERTVEETERVLAGRSG